jgi:hypothetical protein
MEVKEKLIEITHKVDRYPSRGVVNLVSHKGGVPRTGMLRRQFRDIEIEEGLKVPKCE